MNQTLRSIRKRLQGVRRTVRMLYVVDGAMRVLVALVLVLAAGFLLDRLIEFPRPMRIGLLVSQLALLCACCYRYLVYPLKVPISVEDIAGQVELRNPFLKDRLISALQLECLLESPEYADSRQLTQAVIREAEEAAGGISFRSILDPRPVLLSAVVTLAVLIGAVSSCIIWNQQAKIWVLRNLMLSDVNWPRKNQVYLVRRSFKVKRGESLKIRFLLDEIPQTDTPIELRVLELVQHSGKSAPGAPPAKRQGLKASTAKRGAEPNSAVRYSGELADLPDLLERSPSTLFYKEISVPLTRRKGDEGVVLEATLPPSNQRRLFFLRAWDVRSTMLFEAHFERVLTPFYEAVSVRRAKSGQVALVPLPDTSIFVPLGHNLKLEAAVFGPIERDRTTIKYNQRGNEEQQSDLMVSLEHGNRFVYEDFVEVRKELQFYLASGDMTRGVPTYQVRVRVPPQEHWHKIQVQYPSYLGMQADPSLASPGNRDFLEMPVGTVFNFRVTGEFSRPEVVKGRKRAAIPFAAWLRFSAGLATEMRLTQISGPTDVKGRPGRVHVTFGGKFMATHDTGFFFRMRGPNRLFNEDARHYQVSVRPDSPPRMSLLRPNQSGQPYYLTTRDASVKMILRATDDHGLRGVLLRYRLDGETDYRVITLKKAKHSFSQSYPAGKAPVGETKDETFTYPWELERIKGLKAGTKIHFHFQAEDYAPFSLGAEGKLVTRSHGNWTFLRGGYSEHQFIKGRSDYRILIVTKLEMVQHLNERLMMLRREVMQLAKTQSDIKKTTEGYATNKSFSANDLDQVFGLELRQNDLTRSTEHQVRLPLMAIEELYRENHLKPGTDVGEMVRLCSAVVLRISPGAANLLKKAQSASDPAYQRENLRNAVTREQEVLEHLDSMLEEMQKWEDLSEVIREAQELLNFQKKINAQTKTLKRR